MKLRLIVATIVFLALLTIVNAEILATTSVQDSYNINENIPLQATITHSQDQRGYVKANINCNAKSLDYFVTPFSFKITSQELAIPGLTLTKDMMGSCSLSLLMLDLNNNVLGQTLVKLMAVSDKLNLNTVLEDYSLNPGDELIVKGTVRNIRNLNVDKYLLTILLDDKTYEFGMEAAEFEKEIMLDEKIKSNKHSIKVSARDDYENNAEANLELEIIPKPVELKNLINKLEFLPGEDIEITSVLVDQAGDSIENDAQIKIFNPDNNYVTQGYGKIIYKLSSDSPPGTWIIRTAVSNFAIESRFVVKELKQVDFSIEDGILYVKNTGNTNYNDVLNVKLNDKEFTRDISVKPGSTESIDLSKKTDPGVYDVVLQSLFGSKDFQGINIPKNKDPISLTGNTLVKTGNTLIAKPYLIIILLTLGLVTVYLINKNKKLGIMRREREYQLASMQMQRIRKEKGGEKFKPKKFSQLSSEELSDYRKQLVKNMKAESKKEDENPGYQYKSPKNPGSKGLFSMFD